MQLPISRPRILRGPRLANPLESPVVETARLTLRPHRLDDADEWYRLQSIPEINHYMRWPERTRLQSYVHLRDRTHHTRLSQANDFLALAVELDGHLIGDVSLRLRTVTSDTRSVEIAWILDPELSGHGYATEAAAAALDLAFIDLEARWAVALVDTHNERSVSLAERLGLQGVPVDHEVTGFFCTPALREASRRVCPVASTPLLRAS